MKEEMTNRIYISGAMTNDPLHEYKFNAAEKILKESYDTVINPVKLSKDVVSTIKDPNYMDFLIYDISMMRNCKNIFMLKGWEQSPGARAEHAVATACGMNIIYQVCG